MSTVSCTIRSLKNRYETQTRLSGETSSLLRALADGAEAYARLQSSERSLRAGKEALDASVASVADLRIKMTALQRQVAKVSEACVLMCEAQGETQARAVLEADAHDAAAIADSIAEYVREVPPVGAGLAKWLRELRSTLVESETALADANSAVEELKRTFASQLHRSASMVSQGRAMLVALGASLPRVRSARPRKPRLTVVPQPAATPLPVEPISAAG